MYQVGDTVRFEILPVPSTGTQIYSYVWKLWDDTVVVTTAPQTGDIKVNIGGEPGTGLLDYSVTPVQIDGQSVVISGSITANNSPSIAPSPTVSNNDSYFPYQTELSVVAFDMDGDTFTFGWYANNVLLSNGTSSYAGNVSGTWSGNGTTIVGTYSGTQNVLDTTISADETITCSIIDSRGGTTTLDFEMRGANPPPPQVAISGAISGLTADASNLPEQRIGVGQSVIFSAYGKSLTGEAVTFHWSFAGSNNWTVPVETAGTLSALPDGGYQSVYEKDISGELVSTGTQKVAVAVAVVTSGSSDVQIQQPVTLVSNTPPTEVIFTVKNNGTTLDQSLSYPAGIQLEYDAEAVDPNGDIVEYAWAFDQPSGVSPSTLNLWGAKVFLDTATYPSGSTVGGVLVVTDRMGGTLSVETPFVAIQ